MSYVPRALMQPIAARPIRSILFRVETAPDGSERPVSIIDRWYPDTFANRQTFLAAVRFEARRAQGVKLFYYLDYDDPASALAEAHP